MAIPWKTLKEVQKRGDKARKDIEKITPRPPQEGLVPIGKSPFYITPGDPADPRDCNRYPNSPWCGGNPFNRKPFQLTVEVVADECNIGIQINPTFGFIRTPPVQIVYRNPGCRPIPPPPELPDKNETEYFDKLPDWTDKYDDNDLVLLGYATTNYQAKVETDNMKVNVKEKFILGEVVYPKEGSFYSNNGVRYIRAEINDTVIHSQGGQVYRENLADVPDEAENADGRGFGWIDNTGSFTVTRKFNISQSTNPDKSARYFEFLQTTVDESANWLFGNQIGSAWYFGTMGEFRSRQWAKKSVLIELDGASQSRWDADFVYCNGLPPSTPFDDRNRLNPPPPEPCTPCMTCCCNSSSNSDNDALLMLILQRIGTPTSVPIYDADVTKQNPQGSAVPLTTLFSSIRTGITRTEITNRIIGIEEYPASLPESFIKIDGKESGQVQINNLTALHGYFIQRFDEIMGQFEIPIKIKDTDLAKEGDQGAETKLPNMAEAIAEMMGLLIDVSIHTNVLLNMGSKTLIESGQDKQQGYVMGKQMDAVMAYIGCETVIEKKMLPMSFTPGEVKIDKFLKEKQVEVPVPVYKEKSNLKTVLHDLLHSAAIIRAVFWRKVKKD